MSALFTLSECHKCHKHPQHGERDWNHPGPRHHLFCACGQEAEGKSMREAIDAWNQKQEQARLREVD
jgi:hypothetical protein